MPSPLEPLAPSTRPLRSTLRRPVVFLPALLAVAVGAAALTLPSRQGSTHKPAQAGQGSPSGSTATPTREAGSTSAGNSPTTSGSASSTATAQVSGVSEGQVIGKAALRGLVFQVSGVPVERLRGSVDGRPITFEGNSTSASIRPGLLADGSHTLEVLVAGAPGDTTVKRIFTVDTSPPKLEVSQPKRVAKGQALTITGTAESGSTVTANGQSIPVQGDRWSTRFATAPASVRVVASDPAGNTSTQDVAMQFPLPLTRAVHMTARAWGYKPKHDAVMALLRARKINAVEVDIKDEDGLVGYATKVPLATTVGAVAVHYDPKKMVAEIHAAGGRVIGRLVAFRDPALTKWAWTSGHRDMVLQKTDGTPWTGVYGAFAFPNFSNSAVQKYNVDLAVEAATLGFDDVLYDYVRRPDGKLSQMRIPGLRGSPEASVARVLAATKAGFARAGVTTYLGASVFGIAATRPTEIAQDITMMAPSLDYVAPMVYPSHWAAGEYKVACPNRQPYDIVQRSLKDFQTKLRGTNATVVPWLQDFSLRVKCGQLKYGPDQVRAQIKASSDDQMPGFLLWNAGANYTGAALTPMPQPQP